MQQVFVYLRKLEGVRLYDYTSLHTINDELERKCLEATVTLR